MNGLFFVHFLIMKKRFFIIYALLISCVLSSYAQPKPCVYEYGLEYFLPQTSFQYTLNQAIPTPESVLGYQVGQQHAYWSDVVNYFYALAAASDRVTVKEMGRTYQHKPFLEVVITSAENQKNIGAIRAEHLQLTDTKASGSLDITKMPVVVNLTYSVHGNEASGVNASLAVGYFLAAAQGAEIERLLSQTVITMTPGANPDGINRFASWINTTRSLTPVADLNSREFTEAWPSSRTNHYWADCNRDWLMLQHPEGINGVETYFDWMPNVMADQHEQSGYRTFYFSPGHPKRTHALTPQLNQDLTKEVSSFCAAELDKIGSGYFSKEGYDDYYYGKGASYGDAHGSVCLLYEQMATYGNLRPTVNGVRSFAWTIRNQAYASWATVLASWNMREKLLSYQRDYYKETAQKAKAEAVKGYVLTPRSKAVAFHFLENMKRHRIDVYHNAKDSASFVVPVDQKYSTMVKAVMENVTAFDDSTFYDISTWTFPHAFNLKCEPVKSTAGLMGLLGERVTEVKFPEGKVIGGKASYSYLFEVQELYAYKMIYELQRRGLYVAACNRPAAFGNTSVKRKIMGYGTVEVMLQNQPLSKDEIYDLMVGLSKECGVDVYASNTGLMEDTDSASPAYATIKQPKVAVLVGRGASVPESGEVWHLLDFRLQMRPVIMECNALTLSKLQGYNTLIMAGNVPNALTKEHAAAIKEWVALGGTLIATGNACDWVKKAELLNVKFKSTVLKKDSTAYLPYEEKRLSSGNAISGVILNVAMDKSHPLCWGMAQDEIPLFKANYVIFQKDKDPYVSPLHYTTKPYLSGFISKKNLGLIASSPAVIAKPYKAGRVIIFDNDMTFRSYWFGTTQILLNAIFFNSCIK